MKIIRQKEQQQMKPYQCKSKQMSTQNWNKYLKILFPFESLLLYKCHKMIHSKYKWPQMVNSYNGAQLTLNGTDAYSVATKDLQ